MKNKRNVSRLSDHKLKKGIIATPLNDALGDLLKTSSWARERMPEYLWLGLILHHYGRKEGFMKAFEILHRLSNAVTSLSFSRLSLIFDLPEQTQRIVYEIICDVINKKILSPLTIIYRARDFPTFNEYFYIPQINVEDRVKHLSDVIKAFSSSQSNEGTDLRYLQIVLPLILGKFKLPSEIIQQLHEYPYTKHEDERMQQYRPSVRCMEGTLAILDDKKNSQFVDKFWRDIGMLSQCNPWRIQFDENKENYKELISDCRKILEYVLVNNKEKSLLDDKFEVINGSINYALKIFNEIELQSLGNSILGRHGIRTIAEILIMLKYLIKNEKDKPDIWTEYKAYGIGKYKLVLLKARENETEHCTHFVMPLIDSLVNEHKYEEFTDIDLKYFDKQGIREKSHEIREKTLYDLLYDYDSSFLHGLWGAIRESAMLQCNNESHRFHCVPDIYANQNCPDVKKDCVVIIKKLFSLLKGQYEIPGEYITWMK